MPDNTLYYGDNLKILRDNIKDESIDLIYLDPPFNSKADYNILFREPTGEPSDAQITAFEDTWHWTEETERTFNEILKTASASVVEMMRAFRQFVGTNDVMAYLTMMCIRLLELKRVLKDTGSIYLHCDLSLLNKCLGSSTMETIHSSKASQNSFNLKKYFKLRIAEVERFGAELKYKRIWFYSEDESYSLLRIM